MPGLGSAEIYPLSSDPLHAPTGGGFIGRLKECTLLVIFICFNLPFSLLTIKQLFRLEISNRNIDNFNPREQGPNKNCFPVGARNICCGNKLFQFFFTEKVC